MNLLRPNSFLILLSIFFVTRLHAQTPLACDGKFYVSHANGSSYIDSTYIDKISFKQGSAIQTPLGNSGTIGLNAIGFNPIDGFVYGMRYASGFTTPELIRIDAAGNFTSLGVVTGAFPQKIAWAGCFDGNGNYYVTEDALTGNVSSLYKIDVNTNVSTLVGSTGLAPQNGGDILFVDLAVNPTDGKLYGVSSYCCGENGPLSCALFSIDTATGLATYINRISPNGSYFGMFFNDQGQLFVYANNGDLFIVDPATGFTTFVGNGVSFTFADACSCVFRVSTFLSATPQCIASTAGVDLTVSTRNYSGSIQPAIAYDLTLPDIFQFTQSAAAIQTALIPTYGGAVNVSISSAGSGINNQLNITGMAVPKNDPLTQVNSFTLNTTVPSTVPTLNYAVQGHLSGLNALLGTDEYSDDPTTVDTDDSTQIVLPSGCVMILPVQLLTFNATKQNNTVLVSWATTAEVNNSYFEIQHSTDGLSWASVGKNNAVKNSGLQNNYSFTDVAPVTGNNFYRIKQVDINGGFKYSTTKLVVFNKLGGIAIYPNPSKGYFNLIAHSSETLPYEILDVSGRLIRSGTLTNTIKVAGLAPGVYAARVHVQSGTEVVKIIVQ